VKADERDPNNKATDNVTDFCDPEPPGILTLVLEKDIHAVDSVLVIDRKPTGE
jgi:hypothetical protein